MRFYRCFILVMLLSCLFSGIIFAAEIVTLKDGTPVMLRLTEEVSTRTKNINDFVHFEVSRDVIVDGKVVIKAGSPAEGTVTSCTKPDILGQEGTICFMANSTKLVDGQYVSLRANLSRTGKSNMLLSAGAAWVCCPICALIQGGGASFPVGSECKAYTENDIKVKVD